MGVILAKRSVFEEPQRFDFLLRDGSVNPRIVGCSLKRCIDGTCLDVIGVHLSGKGYDVSLAVEQIEAKLSPSTILGGDFNFDLRRTKDFAAEAPKFQALMRQTDDLPKNAGTTGKERSPFQAQTSKIFMKEFAMKDFLFAGSSFDRGDLSGLIPRSRCLPDAKIPSDHSLLTMH